MWVAECDIRSFFDCVAHGIAREAFAELIQDATRVSPKTRISDRAMMILEAYFRSYSFSKNIQDDATKALKIRDPDGSFPWPSAELETLHQSKDLRDIGVPQGGALSGVIANAVLHIADKRIEKLRRSSKKAFTYLRYCDDMILLSNDCTTCNRAFECYTLVLRELLLPMHLPKNVTTYDDHFWEGKSNAPYLWFNLREKCGIPWIQFVGFQIRHDGLIRVRPKSLKKQRSRITTAADNLLSTLNPGRTAKGENPPFAKGIRKRKAQIVHRFRQQLISVSVGRRTRGQDLSIPMPMCWANGFRGMVGRNVVQSMLKTLDRHRERQVQRVIRRVQTLPEVHEKRTGVRVEKYYGFPFSYFGQFAQKPSKRY
jgi:hypothetical protein